jgi:hypothetical protein
MLFACVTEEGDDDDMDGDNGGSGMMLPPVDTYAAYLGSYQTTITVQGTGSQALTDSMSINKGTTADLILQSQQLGALQAKALDGGAFAITQQQITLTDAYGQAFSVTIMGQGTVVSGVFNASGQLSSSNGAVGFTIAGRKL